MTVKSTGMLYEIKGGFLDLSKISHISKFTRGQDDESGYITIRDPAGTLQIDCSRKKAEGLQDAFRKLVDPAYITEDEDGGKKRRREINMILFVYPLSAIRADSDPIYKSELYSTLKMLGYGGNSNLETGFAEISQALRDGLTARGYSL